MPNYNTGGDKLQVVVLADSTGKEITYHVDPDTGGLVEPLRDDRFAWRDRKQRTLALADCYKAGGDGVRANKSVSCSTWLQYLSDGEQKQLHHFNACKQRLCPLCSARRAKILAGRLSKILAKVSADHAGTQLIFLTLTVANVPGDQLKSTLDLLTEAWHKLIRRRPVVRAVKGTFRAIEITRNRDTGEYHPHIHAILVVEDAYFLKKSGLYLDQPTWEAMWQQSLKVPYKPRVDIRSTYAKGKRGPSKAARKAAAAAVEAAKYATKDSDFLDSRLSVDEAAQVVKTYTDALAYKRMIGMSGWVKEAAAALKLEMEEVQDLVHDDETGTLTAETASLLEDYGWHFGLAEHVLTARYANPEFQGT